MARQTIGNDFIQELDESPMDNLLSAPKDLRKENETPQIKVKDAKAELTIEKDRLTIQISKHTIERVKDAVYWERSTVAQFVEEALEVALNNLEKQNGEPYQKRKAELKPGRPLK